MRYGERERLTWFVAPHTVYFDESTFKCRHLPHILRLSPVLHDLDLGIRLATITAFHNAF